MKPVTQKYIKEATGLSKQAISKACAAGHLTMCVKAGKKMVDLDGHLTAKWLAGRKKKNKKEIVESEPPPENPYLNDIQEIEPSNNPSGLSNELFQSKPGSPISQKRKLEEEKLEEQIEDLRIKNQTKRTNLIAKKLVIKVFNRMYSIDENQLKPIGINVMPKISSVYNEANAYKTNQILENLEKKEDTELKSEILKILNAGEDDRINEGNQILEDEIGSVLKNIKRETEKFLKNIEELGK